MENSSVKLITCKGVSRKEKCRGREIISLWKPLGVAKKTPLLIALQMQYFQRLVLILLYISAHSTRAASATAAKKKWVPLDISIRQKRKSCLSFLQTPKCIHNSIDAELKT